MAISLNNAGLLGSNFVAWWLGELKAMWLPVQQMLRRSQKMLCLDTSGQQWVLRLQKGSRHQDLGQLDPQSPPSIERKVLAATLRKAKLGGAELTVLLADSKGLRRPLDMPAISETDLRQALYFEIERQTPFRPEDVYFDYRVIARRPESKRLLVELIAAPRSTVDQILNTVKEWGVQTSMVDIVPRDGQSGIGVNLLKVDQPKSRWTSARIGSALVFASLLAAVFYVPVSQLSTEDEALASQVAEESAKAKETLAKRAELDETLRAAAFLDERKKTVPGVLGVLNELTKALPDNTWLVNLTRNEGDIKISGYSAAAAELIPLIDAVQLFKNPTFSSPIVQDPLKKIERFDISFELEPSGAKP